jgi:hypothetical protein
MKGPVPGGDCAPHLTPGVYSAPPSDRVSHPYASHGEMYSAQQTPPRGNRSDSLTLARLSPP